MRTFKGRGLIMYSRKIILVFSAEIGPITFVL